jgi:hypothetical protein
MYDKFNAQITPRKTENIAGQMKNHAASPAGPVCYMPFTGAGGASGNVSLRRPYVG